MRDDFQFVAAVSSVVWKGTEVQKTDELSNERKSVRAHCLDTMGYVEFRAVRNVYRANSLQDTHAGY